MSWVSLVQLTMERTKEKKILERKGLRRKKKSSVRFEVLRGKKRRRRRRAVVERFGLKRKWYEMN